MRIAQIAPPWIPKIVEHGTTGFLVRNVDEMVQSIPGIDEIDREKARAHVEHNFPAQVMAEKYTRVYEKVMAMNKAASRHPENEATRRNGATTSSVRAT